MINLNRIQLRLKRLWQFYQRGRALLALGVVISVTLVFVHPIFTVVGGLLLLILVGNTIMGIQEAQARYIEKRFEEQKRLEEQKLLEEQRRSGEQSRLDEQRHLEEQKRVQADIVEAQKIIQAQKLDGVIFHVTHWKAGSQWIRNIFEEIFPLNCIVPAEVTDHCKLSERTIKTREVYTPFYGSMSRFDDVQLDTNIYRFFVIRDLRDTLISAYFSIKNSHVVTGVNISGPRTTLNDLPQEDGMLYLIEEHFLISGIADIQLSWLNSSDPIIRYEDLIEHDVEILSDLLLNHFQLSIDSSLLAKAIVKHRFQLKTKGRKPGEEDVNAHYRKGIAGDWKNYFSGRVTDAFKQRFGQILIDTGYEKDTNW